MSLTILEERKERILERVKISDVIAVKDRGNSLCPCCNKPNLSVYQSKFAKCFTSYCEFNKAKTVIECYRWKHNIDNYSEALKQIETEFNIPVSYNNHSRRSSLLNKCLDIYSAYLLNNKQAQDYLYNRGFSKEDILLQKIGYAPHSQCLLDSRKITKEELKEVNLYQEGKEYFHNRIIFPIRDISGRLVHLQGRYLGELPEGVPKYKDSRVEKGNSSKDYLAFEENINTIYLQNTEDLYIVEGYPDALSLVSLGCNAVGCLGLEKLTNHYLKLKNFSSLVFIFDNDYYPSDHNNQALEYKSWNKIIPQIYDLQILLPTTYIYTCILPSTIKNKVGVEMKTKDINEWINLGELNKEQVVSYISNKKKEFITKLIREKAFDIGNHLSLLKLIAATNRKELKEELVKYISPSKSLIDYACEVLTK